MPERDEEGRPIATQNAGAFLAPAGVGGSPPVPSSVIDQRGASVDHVSEAEAERRGTPPQATAGQPPAASRAPWVYAVATAIAVWALGFSCLQLLGLSQAEVLFLAAGVVFLVVGLRVGAAHLPARGIKTWAVLLGATLVGVLVGAQLISYWVLTFGPVIAVIVIVGTLVWLAVSYQLRPI